MARILFQVRDLCVCVCVWILLLFLLIPGIFMMTPVSQTKKKRNFGLKLSEFQLET
jgi:hypothetical protein